MVKGSDLSDYFLVGKEARKQVYGVKFLETMAKKCAMRMGGDFYSSAVSTTF